MHTLAFDGVRKSRDLRAPAVSRFLLLGPSGVVSILEIAKNVSNW